MHEKLIMLKLTCAVMNALVGGALSSDALELLHGSREFESNSDLGVHLFRTCAYALADEKSLVQQNTYRG